MTVVVLLASCQDEIDWGKDAKLSKGQIAFTIGSDETATRAEVSRTVVAPSNVIELQTENQDGQGFCLIETVSQLGEETFDTYSGAVTRGTPVYTENFEALYGGFVGTPYGTEGSAFGVNDNVDRAYITDEPWKGNYRVDFSLSDAAKHMYVHDFYDQPWPLEDQTGTYANKLLFFLESPKNIEAVGVGNPEYYPDGSMQFDYTSPTEPTAQKDILFTSRWIEKGTKNTDNKVRFYHALTGVKFKLGYNTTHDVKVKIDKIIFHNYPSTGHCTVTPLKADGTPENLSSTKSSAVVTWKNLANPRDFTIDFTKIYDEDGNLVSGDAVYKNADGTIIKDNQGNPVVEPNVPGLIDGTEEWGDDRSFFPNSFFANSSSTTGVYAGESTADRNFNNKYYEYTFMFIPHEKASADAYIEIHFTYTYSQSQGSGSTYMPNVDHKNESRVALPSFAKEWRPGELHTYILTSEGVDILTEDSYNPDTDWKEALNVVNVGTYPEWQRTLMCANWVYTDTSEGRDNHLIVADAKISPTASENTGKFCNTENVNDPGGFIGENWALGSDGYYYYRYPINVGNKPNFPLFRYYKAPQYSTFGGTHLEFAISSQAYRYSDDTTAGFGVAKVVSQWNLSGVTIEAHGRVTKNQISTVTANQETLNLGTADILAAKDAYVRQPMSNWLQPTMEVFNEFLPGNHRTD